MDCIGLLTANGADVSLRCIQQLHDETKRILGRSHSAYVVGVNITDPCPYGICEPRGISGLDLVFDAAKRLQCFGAQHLLLGSPDLHLFYDELSSLLKIPVIDAIQVTADALSSLKLSPVGLIGDSGVDSSELWSSRLAERSCGLLLPSAEKQARIKECLQNRAPDESSRLEFVETAVALRSLGARALILSTPLVRDFLAEEDSVLPLVCSTELQVRLAVKEACFRAVRK